MNTSSPPNFQASFVIPVFNEQDTIRLLVDKISSVMLKEEIKFYEIIFIDDGSTDDSWQQIKETINIFPEHVKAIQFRKNFGKSAALNAGFQSSQGEVIFTLSQAGKKNEMIRYQKHYHQNFLIKSHRLFQESN